MMAGISIIRDISHTKISGVELITIRQPQQSPTRSERLSPDPSFRIAYEFRPIPGGNDIATQNIIENNHRDSLVHTDNIPEISRWRYIVIIGTISMITLINSMFSGLLVVDLPTMAKDLGLADHLLLWPASVNAYAE
jgi:hypothetical protein